MTQSLQCFIFFLVRSLAPPRKSSPRKKISVFLCKFETCQRRCLRFCLGFNRCQLQISFRFMLIFLRVLVCGYLFSLLCSSAALSLPLSRCVRLCVFLGHTLVPIIEFYSNSLKLSSLFSFSSDFNNLKYEKYEILR